MIDFKEIYDIGTILGEESTDFPGDQPFSLKPVLSIKDGSEYKLSRLELSVHAGTHIDTPAHFFADGKTIDQYSANDFIIPALVVDIEDENSIRPEVIAATDVRPGEALIFRTANSTSGLSTSGSFKEKFVHLTKEAAYICIQKGISLVGIDYISIEKYESTNYEVHKTLLGAGVLILESLNLKEVPPGRYTLMCFPMKLKGAEAAPARAILIR